MSEKEELEVCKKAIKGAINSSVPYIAEYGAFMISAESWNELCCLIDPNVKKLSMLLDKIKQGIKLTEEEINDALHAI